MSPSAQAAGHRHFAAHEVVALNNSSTNKSTNSNEDYTFPGTLQILGAYSLMFVLKLILNFNFILNVLSNMENNTVKFDSACYVHFKVLY